MKTHGTGRETKKAFKKIKRALTNTLALGLPDKIKPFFLYVPERLGAVGVLTQMLGSCTTWWPIYQSNFMQFPQAGHPPCAPWQPLPSWWLKQTNLLWNKKLIVQVPHCVLTHMEHKENYWLTNSQMVKWSNI
jgi:hypothetical protein